MTLHELLVQGGAPTFDLTPLGVTVSREELYVVVLPIVWVDTTDAGKTVLAYLAEESGDHAGARHTCLLSLVNPETVEHLRRGQIGVREALMSADLIVARTSDFTQWSDALAASPSDIPDEFLPEPDTPLYASQVLPQRDQPAVADSSAGGSQPDTAPPRQVSSPMATGGAGTAFEQQVGAHWLALLLVGGIPPIMTDCTVMEVHFQTEHLGRETDDFMVVGQDDDGVQRHLLGQVKLSFTVSDKNNECRKAFLDWWCDFKSGQFDERTDRLALVTQRGTITLLQHFGGLLDCARTAGSAGEFERRLATRGFISSKSVKHCETVRTILDEAEGEAVPLSQVWAFLKVLHVLSLDLATSTAQSEAHIKSLLAHTTADANPRQAADVTWGELLLEASAGMPAAKSYGRSDLPNSARRRHSTVSTADRRALTALVEHSQVVLAGIRSRLGDSLRLPRAELVQSVVSNIEAPGTRVIMLAGPAGGGKSVIAKSTLDALAGDRFVLCCRAEEFARPHLDDSPIGPGVRALLAGQGKKILLVESVERLLEKSTRDAFADLLRLVARDETWQILLTCRDYSADLVGAAFLEPAGVAHTLLRVPLLADAELESVSAASPEMAGPLGDARLRVLLRNPYFLDMAMRMPWPSDEVLPQSEREFRRRFWREVVLDERNSTAEQMRRREHVFEQIAVRRARALTPYANCSGLDANTIAGLVSDSLVVVSTPRSSLAAPAHDVLEDWAIMQWVDSRFAEMQGAVADFFDEIGAHPAIRRTFRKWLPELLETNETASDLLFDVVLSDVSLTAQNRDDALVAMLLSDGSRDFISRHRQTLFQDQRLLLRRVIHLLRVGCTRPPDWLRDVAGGASPFSVPDGPAWAVILELIQQELGSFPAHELPLLLGFVEDWSSSVAWWSPHPEGSDAAAAIAHALIPQFDNYRSKDELKRTLQIVAKLPRAAPEAFASLLRGRTGEGRDHVAEELRKMVFAGMDGMAAARDMPDVVVEVAREYFFCSEEELRDWRAYRSTLGTELAFGIREARNHDFFPPSAYRGIFFHLFRHSPRVGFDFVVEFLNHSTDWYARGIVPDVIEPPFEVHLSFADGSDRVQAASVRLWNLYRATSVGPYCLQAALMALEFWLLEVAEKDAAHLDDALLNLIRQSNSAALTSVAASLAAAFPSAAFETLLVLLSCRECILLDRQRLLQEGQSPTGVGLSMGMFDASAIVHEQERERSDARDHRRRDLEVAVLQVQTGPGCDRVWRMLDEHIKHLPPQDEQTEEDRAWRMALHRMDVRHYSVKEMPSDEDDSGGGAAPGAVILEPGPADADLEERAAEAAGAQELAGRQLGLLMWGMKVFKREGDADADPTMWRARLEQAMAVSDSQADVLELASGGPAYASAICVRDHWEALSENEREWCVDVVCAAVERSADNWDPIARMQRSEMAGDRPAAWAVGALLARGVSDDQALRLRRTLGSALTHGVLQVREYAAIGVGENLGGADRDLALRCVELLASEAVDVQRARDSEPPRYPERRELHVIEGQAAQRARGLFDSGDDFGDILATFDPCTWITSRAAIWMLLILEHAPAEHVSITIFTRVAEALVSWWESDDERRGGARRETSADIESSLGTLLERFLLRIPSELARDVIAPIVGAVASHPDKTRWIVSGLICAEDSQPNTHRFWLLWDHFAMAVQQARWLEGIDSEFARGKEMLSTIFLGIKWKEGVRHWKSLDESAGRIHQLFRDLPLSAAVVEQYAQFLYEVGGESLPGAFITLADRLREGDVRQLLGGGSVAFLLEGLLRRFVYAKPQALKREKRLRDAVLWLLDTLVEVGSSAAYRMRDDFVTPLPVGE